MIYLPNLLLTCGHEVCFQFFTIQTTPCVPAYAYVLLHLGCYLLGLNPRNENAGSKNRHLLHFDTCGQAALLKDCTNYILCIHDVFLLNLFHFVSGSPTWFTLCPRWGHLNAEGSWVNTLFLLVHEIMGWKEALSSMVLPEGGWGGVRCSCRSSSWSRKGEPWSMRKPVEKVTLMNVKHCSLQAAYWSSLVDMTWFFMWAEASSGILPFAKMAATPAHIAYACAQWDLVMLHQEVESNSFPLESGPPWDCFNQDSLVQVMLLPTCWTTNLGAK